LPFDVPSTLRRIDETIGVLIPGHDAVMLRRHRRQPDKRAA
jgi:hypothetical protein